MHTQSKVVEEASREFFETRDVKIGEYGILKGSKVEPTEKSISMNSPYLGFKIFVTTCLVVAPAFILSLAERRPR